MRQLNLLDGMGESQGLSTDIFDYRPGIFSKGESEIFLHKFINEVPWQQTSLHIYGKAVLTPRLTAWYGDGADYPVYGHKPHAHPWTPELLMIKERIEPLAGVTFNTVLINYYRDGSDSVSWHDDEDRTPGKNMFVASVSFGQERIFDIRRKDDHAQKISVLLEDGSYILMKGDFQSKYEHRIAKSTKPMKPRINLTFRRMI